MARESVSLLLVEDDPTLVSALRLSLGARGFHVSTAGSGREAVSHLRENEPDAVAADLGLPDLSGPELVGALRQEAPGARIVVLTGETSERLERACREAGADDYLVKPVTADQLGRALG